MKTHLNKELTNIAEWFTKDFIILNHDKCHYIYLEKDIINNAKIL